MKETVFLTGATAGIGEELAMKLSQKYNVVLSGRNVKKLESLKDKCTFGNQVHLLPLNLSDLEHLEGNISTFLKEKDITIEKFVHCAGFMKMVPLKMVTHDLMLETFSTNIFSASTIVKILTNKKVNNSALNSVVFVSSNISNRGAKAMSTYGASKSALDGLMMSLAVELAPKVRINSVLPGAVKTEMTKHIFENEKVGQRMGQQYPLGIGSPEDLVGAVAFLLSEDAKWITGQQITVDGGRSINVTG